MQDITATKTQTLPEKLRKEHVPQTGDVFLYRSSGREEVIRLGKKEVREGADYRFVNFHTELWSFAEKKWIQRNHVLSENDLKEYYTLCLAFFDELLDDAEKVFRGETAGEEVKESDTEELVSLGTQLPDMLSTAEMLQDRMNTLNIVCKARMNEQIRLMEEKMKPLKAVMAQTEKQLLNIRRAISIVEIYQGQNVEVLSLCTGTPADRDVPVTLRQRILFMDEECAVLDEEGQGLDYWTRDRFYEWLKTPSHRDVILPEQKCVVVMKPRRYDKPYSGNAYEQTKLNEWNRHSFIVIRNGENVSVIESDNLCVYGAAVPRKADYDRIEEEAKNWGKDAEKELGDINYRCIHLAMTLQGVCDHSDIFAPCGEVNFLKGIGTQIVFDDETDSLIGTGRQNFRDWLKEQAKTVRRGSRIIYVRGISEGEPMRWELRGGSWNGYRPKIAEPETGLYTVEEKDGGKLGFAYLPADSWNERKRRETWLFDPDTVLNYDTISADDLKAYLEDRSQRRYYQGIIPVLRKYLLEKEKERGYEELFVSALRQVLDEKHIAYTNESLQEALRWWKNKVIHIRPISSDDDKAWRMILGHVRKH